MKIANNSTVASVNHLSQAALPGKARFGGRTDSGVDVSYPVLRHAFNFFNTPEAREALAEEYRLAGARIPKNPSLSQLYKTSYGSDLFVKSWQRQGQSTHPGEIAQLLKLQTGRRPTDKMVRSAMLLVDILKVGVPLRLAQEKSQGLI